MIDMCSTSSMLLVVLVCALREIWFALSCDGARCWVVVGVSTVPR